METLDPVHSYRFSMAWLPSLWSEKTGLLLLLHIVNTDDVPLNTGIVSSPSVYRYKVPPFAFLPVIIITTLIRKVLHLQ